MSFQKVPVLIVGDERISFSIAVCLLQADHRVTLCTRNCTEAERIIDTHFSDLRVRAVKVADRDDLEIVQHLPDSLDVGLVIAVTEENLDIKRSLIEKLENVLPKDTLVAINTESIPLSQIQEGTVAPERIVGANWVEPVHTTYFLEIISNGITPSTFVDRLVSTARRSWHKDPYVLKNNNGIRSRMMSAMVREAFFLVENGYVSLEDIDRACRNDPGYYLPFAGHCRYMDLMGTYVYGVVMKDLNPELSKNTHIPEFFRKIVAEGGEGIRNRKGFYTYTSNEVERRAEEFRNFSFEIRDIISRYPFSDTRMMVPPKKKAIPNI